MDGTYAKGGSAGSKGVDFQVGLLQVFLLNALTRLKGWRLSTENMKAGKFDDVVLELEDSGTVLLQAKFKENTKSKKITLNHLLSVNTKNDDFSIPKYFFSYEEIKKTFLVKKVIICTNASFDKTALEFLKSEIICPDSMLHYKGSSCLMYTFNEEILPVLREHVENYCKINLKGKVIDEAVINDENLKEFLQNLQFYFDYPPEIDVEKVTQLLLSDLKRTNDLWQNASVSDIHNKLKEWFQQPRGEYFTESRAKAMFCEIRSDKYCQMLENYNLSFVNKTFTFAESKRLFHLVAEREYLLKAARIHQALRSNKTKILYVSSEDTAGLQRETIETFQLPLYTFLIIIRPKFVEERVAKEVGGKLGHILEKYNYKKIVLVDQSDSKLARYIGFGTDTEVIKDPLTFTDLSKVIRKKLLKKKMISLQGYDISLKELFGIQKTEDCNENINSELLEKLIKDEKIQIGTPVLDLDENISRHYIERKFQREVLTKEGTIRLDEFSECDIYKIEEKFVSFADSAGTGKSTVLSNLAMRIKKEHPNLWIIKIELKSYTRFLKECLKKNKETVSITQILDCTDSHKLKNDIEKYIFSLKGKVVLMMDGFDEISPYYTKLSLSLFEECIQAPNLFKLFTTTRSHMTPVLTTRFNVIPFSLQPLTEENQIRFLQSCWTHNLKLNDENRKKCEQYARTLVEQMSMYLDDDNFTGLPLHLKILSESFQGSNEVEEPLKWTGCQEYLIAQEEKPKLPQKMNITELYKMFIEKKKDLFLEKENPTGNEVVNEALSDIFDNCLVCHRTLALEVILENKLCKLFTTYQEGKNIKETNVLMMGIIQKVDKDLNFVHKTFAEYFFGETLLAELQRQNQNLEFQKYLIEGMLLSDEFKVTRAFLDWFLRGAVDSLPSNLFHSYQCHEQEVDLEEICRCSLIHLLAKEGCVAILQLIFKCVDFKVIKNAEVHLKDLYQMYDSSDTGLVKGKTLYFIKLLVERAGVNIKDETGWTPLHYAVHKLQVEMVKFLVENGADINNVDGQGRTALEIVLNLYPEEYSKIELMSEKVSRRKCLDLLNFKTIKLRLGRRADVKSEKKNSHPGLSKATHQKIDNIACYLIEKKFDQMLSDVHGPL